MREIIFKGKIANNDEWHMKDGTLLLKNKTVTIPATANTKAICSIKAEDADGK